MTRRALGLGAPSRIAVALLIAALAFAAAIMADGGYGGDNPVFAQTTVDYDDDNDGLIDVRSLAQLNAVRHDLDGNGDPASGGATAYNAAFPNRDTASGTRMGCPSGTCTGYELRAHLDFDTDGDGSTYTGTGASATGDSGDAYNASGSGWTPIGSDTPSANRFTATFKGNGYVISNLFIRRTGTDDVGLFGAITARVESVGLANAYVYGDEYTGSLVGYNRGTVAASWSDGAVRGTRYVGGLVGYNLNGTITASYSHAAAHASRTSGGAVVGGLTGRAHSSGGGTARVIASYATGAVTAGTSSDLAGLSGRLGSSTSFANSYWDTTTSGIAPGGIGAGGAGHATAALQGPTGYTGLYSAWNVNVDGVSGNDDPWDFGTASQYPALKFGGMDPIHQRGDYDRDDDGLIEITTLAQLDAIRHDLYADGAIAAGAPLTAYNAAFLNRAAAATRMGCPAGACSGYELAADLDFDTDGDGATYTGTGASATSDSGDDYHNSGSGFEPIGGPAGRFSATFKGNGYVISNLFIRRTNTHTIGLFGFISDAARVESVGVENAYVYGRRDVGGLVGRNSGLVAASYTTGYVRGGSQGVIGGLVGYILASGRVTASYSTAAVSADSSGQHVGGLVGTMASGSRVNAGYSTGTVTSGATSNVGGFLGSGAGTVTASYWDTTTSGLASSIHGSGQATADLQTVLGYTGVYAGWNVDVDGVAGGDDP